MSTTVSATQGSVAVGSIQVGGDVNGDIIIGNHNFKVNTNYGTIVYNAPAEPAIKRRDAKPQPPRAPLDFFDRAGELSQVEQLIRQGKPVVICGSDGAGKSALLRQAANGTAAHTLPDGAILLEGLDEQGRTLLPGDVIQRWFDAFYLSEPPLKVTAASAQPYLSQLRPLVLLDHVALDADQLRPLLDLFPNSPALIARPAALPGLARPIKLGPLPRNDAIDLFAATSGLLINDANRASMDAICALLNDVPLAVVRAADVIREMNLPLDQAHARLEAAPTAAGDSIAIGLSRAAALIQSALTPLEKQILGAAANLPGISIDPNKIAALIEGAQADAVEASIEHLKALGLLHANSPRVRLDAGLRDFWRGASDGNTIKDRLLAQLLRDQKDGRFSDDEYCADELGHVLGAIDYAAQTQQWSATITLSRAIDRYVTLHGLWDAWGQIADRVLQSARAAGDRSNEAWALHQLGTRAIGSDKTQAIDLLKQALSVRQTIGETTAAAYTQHNLDILIPPPIPPKGSEGTAGPAGLSGAAKLVIAVVIIGLAAVAAVAVAGVVSPSVTPTPVVVVVPPNTPTNLPATPTNRPPTNRPPSGTPTATRTATRTPTSTATATDTATPTDTPTPTPAALIPYLEQVGNAYEIFVSNADGAQRTQLTEQSATGNYEPALSPDGESVAYWSFGPVSVTRVQARQLIVMNLADRQPRLLFSGQPYDARIVWSPQSDYVAVTLRTPSEGAPQVDIYLVPINGGKGQPLTSPQLDDYFVHTDPSFSPDGSRLAYVPRASGDFGGVGINIVNLDGSNLQRLKISNDTRVLDVQSIAWSPTAEQIAFAGRDLTNATFAEARASLYLVNSDGGNLQPLIPQTYGLINALAWRPDGKMLAYLADNVLWRLQAGGRPQVISRGLSADPNGCTFVPWFIWLGGGQRLAYNTDRSGPIEIHTISFDGRNDLTLKSVPPSYLRLPQGCVSAPIATATPIPVIP
jgi:Tol biopolymer transport system component